MKAVFRLKAYGCAVLMLCTAMGSSALTLGRAQGAVFVGKPLDLRVQVQFDSAEEVQASCMEAEVYYGDSRLESSRVSVAMEPAGAASALGSTVRVTSSVLVNEPVVTVNFRVGCQQKLSKRYTIFPEVSTSVVEPIAPKATSRATAPQVNLPALPAAPSRSMTPQTREREVQSTEPDAARLSSALEKPVAKPARQAKEVTPTPPMPVVRLKPPAKGSGKSRLTLDSLDLLIDRDPILRVTPELLTLPQEDLAARAEAAALWRSLNITPEDLVLQGEKAKAFEKDLKSLYAVTAQNQKGLMDLVSKVDRAESERYANGLVYTLGGLLMISLLALAWVWRRAQAVTPGNWRDGIDSGDSLMAELVKAPPVSRPRPPPTPAVAPDAPAASATRANRTTPEPVATAHRAPVSASAPLDFDLSDMDLELPPFAPTDRAKAPFAISASGALDTMSRPLSARALAQSGARDASVHVSNGNPAVDSSELLDVRKQANFFMSLGETQQAIDLLVNHIAQVGESSPVVCLDLLKIYYKQGREPEYEALRKEFNNWFTGQVPVIDHFTKEGRGLEKYPNVLDQIVALWPNPRVLEYIENCMYHHSSDEYEPHFDLLAYRELLLLHGVAQRIVRVSDDSQDAAALVRIAARAPSGDTAGDGDAAGVAHRVGAQYRGAWKRNPLPKPKSRLGNDESQADADTLSPPLAGTTELDFLS